MLGNKIGRNDPCPCGSGKKYKKCCLRKGRILPFLPDESFKAQIKEKPENLNQGVKTKDGVLILGGKIELPQIRFCLQPMESGQKEIDELQEIAPKYNPLHEYGLSACVHKLYAVRYHLDKFRSGEQEEAKNLLEGCSPTSGIQMENRNPVFLYEMESFLFQVKSSLDVLAVGPLNRLLGLNLQGFTVNAVVDALERKKRRLGFERVGKLISAVKANEEWIDELNEMRVQITHRSDLKNFCCFVVMPVVEEDQCTVYYPSMPDGKRAIKYMESTWENLFLLYKSILAELRG